MTKRRLLRGRTLTRADAAATTAVVVNEAFITKFELTEPVVGQPLRIALSGQADAAPRHVTIAGVASQPVSAGLTDPMGEAPTVYLPLGTPPDYIAAWISADNAAQMADAVGRTIADLDPELPALAVRTLEDYYVEDNQTLRRIAQTAGGLGIVALRLAGVGLAVGAVLGVPLLIALHANFPFTERFDPAVILPPALALALTALVAGWVPARRASSIQASEALRAD
jgi:hypothetical protein